MNDISEMTGASQYKRPPVLKTNEIRFHGKDGTFYLVDLLGRKEGAKAETTDLGKTLDVVFLKIRRKMSYYDSVEEKFIVTSEHNSKEDTVFLFGPNEKGKASDLRDKYPDLRIQQVVYVLFNNSDVLRLIVKGASLGSKNKADTTTAFYPYLQSFEGDEHVHLHQTNINAVEETGKLGPYMVMDFNRGEKLTPELIEDVEAKIAGIHSITSANDEHYNKQNAEKVVEEEKAEQLETIEYPTEDIAPENIPF